jgi:hypothetical protein
MGKARFAYRNYPENPKERGNFGDIGVDDG